MISYLHEQFGSWAQLTVRAHVRGPIRANNRPEEELLITERKTISWYQTPRSAFENGAEYWSQCHTQDTSQVQCMYRDFMLQGPTPGQLPADLQAVLRQVFHALNIRQFAIDPPLPCLSSRPLHYVQINTTSCHSRNRWSGIKFMMMCLDTSLKSSSMGILSKVLIQSLLGLMRNK